MQINSSQSLKANPATPQPEQQEQAIQKPSTDKKDKVVTVAISPEAQALQKATAAKEAERTKAMDDKRAMEQQAQQQLQAQRPAGKTTQRIDIIA